MHGLIDDVKGAGECAGNGGFVEGVVDDGELTAAKWAEAVGNAETYVVRHDENETPVRVGQADALDLVTVRKGEGIVGGLVGVVVPQLVGEGGATSHTHGDGAVPVRAPGVVIGDACGGGRAEGVQEHRAPDEEEPGHVDVIINIAELDDGPGPQRVTTLGRVRVYGPDVAMPAGV